MVFGRGRFLWVERWVPGEGQKASESKRAEDVDARGRKMQKQGGEKAGTWGGGSKYLGKQNQVLWEGRIGWKGSEMG